MHGEREGDARRENPPTPRNQHAGSPRHPALHSRRRAGHGGGPVTAAALPVWMPGPDTIGNRQAAALAGVAPHPCDSGDRTGRRSVRAGRRRPRRVLYMAAMAAPGHNAPLAAFHRRLVEKGKRPEWRSSRSCESSWSWRTHCSANGVAGRIAAQPPPESRAREIPGPGKPIRPSGRPAAPVSGRRGHLWITLWITRGWIVDNL